MAIRRRSPAAWSRALALIGIAVALPVAGSDHVDAPTLASDPAADLADFYLWPTGRGTVVAIVTFAAGALPGDPATYDPGVLYGIHFDVDEDGVSDRSTWIQFGQDRGDGSWGVRLRGLPGASGFYGPVDEVIDGPGSARAWAGPCEDPFFHDAEGWAQSMLDGALALDDMRDAYAGLGVTAIVVEFDADALRGREIRAWATAGRLP